MQSDLDKIAIVGMACRLPLAYSLNDYWVNLIAGKICTHQTRHWPDGIEATGGFLDDIDSFDAGFFNISPAEAACMDPQLRQLLEVSYQAIDCSGISIKTLRDLNTGVFTTSLPGDYKNLLALNNHTATSTHSFLGNAPSAMSGRLSYFYDFHGPSVTLDTACSSGLTTLNMAQLSILNGDCNAALVGGASVFSTSTLHQLAKESNMLSSSHQCAAFDENADGFVPSEGVVVLLVMKHQIAHELQLPIYGLIESLHLNHNGFSNGLMAPNAKQQHNLIKRCYQKNKIQIADVAVIEAHGTGTKLGDPIELKGLEKVFSTDDKMASCYLGASKAVIGHTLVCSSLASIVKVLLSYEHQVIPPHPLYKTANPHGHMPAFLTINQHAVPWPQKKYYAGVSAFGFTGSNAHLILKFLEKKGIPQHGFEHYFIFSAKNQTKLHDVLFAIKHSLSIAPVDLTHLSARLIKRPKHFTYRVAIFARNQTELMQLLVTLLDDTSGNQSKQIKTSLDTQQLIQVNTMAHQTILQWLQGDDGVFDNIELAIPTKPIPSYPFNKDRHWVVAQQRIKNEPPPLISSVIKQGLCTLLGYLDAEIDESKSLLELGLDSLTGIQFIHFLKERSIFTDIDWIWKATSLSMFTSQLEGKDIVIPTKLSAEEISDHKDELAYKPIFDEHTIEKLQLIRTKVDSITWLVSKNTGIPVMLLPPLNCHYQVWLRQISTLHQQGYQLHIPHYPGHYSNATPNKLFSLQMLADEIGLYAKRMQQKPHVVGWSLGGVLSLLIAIKNQTCLKSMTLIACAAQFDNELFEKTLEMQHELSISEDILKIAFQTQDSIREFISAKTPMIVLKDYYLALMSLSISQEQLQMITIPSQLIYGEKDPVITLKQLNFLSEIPNSTRAIHPEGGHFIPISYAREFNQQLLTFIRHVEESHYANI